MTRSFLPLFATNFFGVVNDNFLKTLASFVVIAWLPDGRLQSAFMGAVAAALVLPYIGTDPGARGGRRKTGTAEYQSTTMSRSGNEVNLIVE